MYAVVAIPRIWHFLVCLDDKRIKHKNIKYKKTYTMGCIRKIGYAPLSLNDAM